MKKFLLVLASLMLAVSAMAQEVKTEVKAEETKKEVNPFKFSGAAYVYGATYKTTTKDEYMSYASYRFRPYLSYKTDNVEATVKLEIDQFLGDKGTATATEKYAKVGGDTKSVLEVKAAYLMFNIPMVKGLSLKGGVDEYKTPGGFIIGTEAGLGLATFKFDTHSISAVYLKIVEGSPTVNQEDAQMYGLDINLAFGGVKVRPALYMIQGEKYVSGKPWTDNVAMLPSLGIALKMDALSVDINGTYASGKDKVTNVKYSGYALDLSPAYEIQKGIKVGAFLTVLSGDKADTNDKKEGFAAFQLKEDGFGRMFLLENQQTYSNIGTETFADVRKKAQGYLLFGGFVTAKMDIVDIKLNLGYGQLMEKVSAAKTKKDLGFEADLSVGFEVEKNAKIIADFAYLATGKAFSTEGFGTTEKQAAIYGALGMSFKF